MGLRNHTIYSDPNYYLRYEGEWLFRVLDNTTRNLATTNDVNANVTLTFPTPANAFYYYGLGIPDVSSYAICIDCDPNDRHFGALDGKGSRDNVSVLLFSQIFPDFGVHEIILENRNDTENSEITIDRFEIQVQDDSSPAPSVRASSSSPPTPSSSSPPSPSAKHVSTGHIVGGVVGVFLLLSLFVFFIVRRRILRRQKRRLRCSFSYLKAEPFLSSHTSDFTSPSDQILSPHGQETESGLENGQGSSTPASSRPNTHSRRSRTRSRSRSRHPKRAIDAGRIIISESGQWHTA